MKINEKELESYIVHFNNKEIVLEYKRLISSIIYIKKSEICYNKKNGFIYIEDSIDRHSCKINIALAYNIDIDNLHNKLIIQLDNNIDIVIKVKN